MIIGLKTDCESTPIVLQIVRSLMGFGTVGVYSSNPSFEGIDDFQNVVFVTSVDGDMEECKELDGYYDGKYDFLILDNLALTDYDHLIAGVTNTISTAFSEDLLFNIENENFTILKFGKALPAPKSQSSSSKSKSSKKESPTAKAAEEQEDAIAEARIADLNYNKWNKEETPEEILNNKLHDKSLAWIPFLTYEEVFDFLYNQKLPKLNQTVGKALFKIVGPSLGIEERIFLKGGVVNDSISDTGRIIVR